MSTPNKLQIGVPLQEYPARSHNHFVDAWFWQRAQLSRAIPRTEGVGPVTVVKARNKTGEDLQFGYAVAIGGVEVSFEDDPDQIYGRPLLRAVKYTSEVAHDVVAICLDSVAVDDVGSFVLPPSAMVRWNVSDAEHKFARLAPNQTTYEPALISGTSGLPVLASEEIPDAEYLPTELWALVLLGGGGGGGTVSAGIVRLSSPCPEAEDGPGGRTPGETTSYEVVDGSVSGTIYNWSLVELPDGVHCAILNDNIYAAFC